MNIFILSIALVAIILSVICKIYGISQFFPGTLLILALILNIIESISSSNKEKREKVNIEEEKERAKTNKKYKNTNKIS